MGRHIHVYDGDDFYVNRDDDFRRWYEQACAVRGILTPEDIAATVRDKNISPHKIIAVSPPEERAAVLAALQQKFGERFYVTTSMEYLVEIVCKGSDKGGALEYLCGHYGIPLAEAIAVGDNYNDLPMVRKAGWASPSQTAKRRCAARRTSSPAPATKTASVTSSANSDWGKTYERI